MRTIRVILADDHALLRVGLRTFLEERSDTELDIQVVGEASSGEEAVVLVEKLAPDVLVLDVSMPGIGGLGATLDLRQRGRPVKILVLTQYVDSISLRRLMEAGANGYLVKTARGDELVSAIRAVADGGTYIDPTMASALLPRADTPPESSSDEELLARLTPRERQVLHLVAEGYSNKQIAKSLDVALKTAMAHRANLMDKLNIHNRSKLVHFAIRMGLARVE